MEVTEITRIHDVNIQFQAHTMSLSAKIILIDSGPHFSASIVIFL